MVCVLSYVLCTSMQFIKTRKYLNRIGMLNDFLVLRSGLNQRPMDLLCAMFLDQVFRV